MKSFLRLVCLACMAVLPALPATWSGWLVSSRCYSSLETNRSDLPSYVNWDRMAAIRYCSPSQKTRSFAIVEQSGLSFTLDPTGNERATSHFRNLSKRTLATADITGQRVHNTITVANISVVKRSGR